MQKSRLVVVGQGYVGLPLAIRASAVGFDVIGVDNNEHRVDALRNGLSFVEDVSNPELSIALESGKYRVTSSYMEAQGFDFAIITVPTPLREGVPDLSFIQKATASLASHLKPGATVVLESTTYPGTTEELVVPLLEEGSGLRAGTDFYVGYSPERIDPGNKEWTFARTPKVISGINDESLRRVQSLYGQLVDVTVPVSGTAEAELTKLLENTFRHVNVALINELALFANQLGVDIWESIEAASTKPFGFMKFTPGPGVGGHCLPVDPSYLSWQVKRKLGRNFRFVELANDINDHMPDYVVQRVTSMLNRRSIPLSDSRILLVGLAYKKNSGDTREAPSTRITELLQEQGARVMAADDHVTDDQWPASVSRVDLASLEAQEVDAAIIVTDHDGADLSRLLRAGTPILDTRNAVSGQGVEKL